MAAISQIAFALITLFAAGLFTLNVRKIIRNIRMAKPYWPNDEPSYRWERVVLNALGQKKMFKRPIPAILHFFVYAGFIIINVEVAEIIIDGFWGTHRIFAEPLGSLYAPLINFFEFLAVTVLLGCLIFLIRRNIFKVRRFEAREMTAWPKMDANLILITEVLLMLALLSMNAADQVLQSRHYAHYHPTGQLFFSGMLVPVFRHVPSELLVAIERFGWWFHIIGIYLFLNYIPYSKHLHIFFAFPNTWYSKIEPMGKMKNMPEITREVQMMLNPDAAMGADMPEPPERFGAKDIPDLNTTDVLAAFSCTECGRCTAVCPANITGKLLSPRKIMMDTRDRAEELGWKRDVEGPAHDDGKSLLGDHILHEEIMACTTCQACVEACPVNIDPLSIITQLRRYIIMDEAASPAQWNVMFGNVENNMAPWQFSPADRFKWGEELMADNKAAGEGSGA